MDISKGLEFNTANATIRVLDNGRKFYHKRANGKTVRETLYLCRDLSGNAELYWTTEQISLYFAPCIHDDCDGYCEVDNTFTNMCPSCYETLMAY